MPPVPLPPHARAAILAIGDELTLGQGLDTNSAWLSERLVSTGILPVEHATVPDDRAAIAAALRRLAGAADLVISTGGLGPTADDLTREGLAEALGEALVRDEAALEQVRRWFASRSRPMPALNESQALRPASAACIANALGTAPGLRAVLTPASGGAMRIAKPLVWMVALILMPFGLVFAFTFPMSSTPAQRVVSMLTGWIVLIWTLTLVVRLLRKDRTASPAEIDAVCLPGPPGEMRAMFEAAVRPLLRPPAGRTVLTRAIHTFGLGESEVATRLGPLMERGRSPQVGTTVRLGVVTCRIRFEGPAAEGPAQVEAAATEIRRLLGHHVFGEDEDTLASVVLATLRERSQTLATVESCTGGLLGGALTAVPGSSAAYLGGWVTYANEFKITEVGLPAPLLAPGGPGAVSRETAEAMAAGGLARSGADHCIAITGIAGPDGGTPEKPVGTVWIALASRDGPAVRSRRFVFAGGREPVRAWSVASATAMLRLRLIGEERSPLLREVSA